MTKVSLVIVSHSQTLAKGVVEVAAQMAPDVEIKPAGGTADGGIGTSYDLVDKTINTQLEKGPVVVLTDLGSATLTVESVMDFLEDEPVYFADGPLVEGAVAAAVAAQQDKSAEEVVAAVAGACRTWSTDTNDTSSAAPSSNFLEEKATLADPDGLHARPAAIVARFVADFDAKVTINGVEANSVMSLMSLGVRQGEEVTLRAEGPEAREALDALKEKLETVDPRN